MTAKEVISLLKLEPLPGEGGFFKETYRSANSTAIYYLITPETFSKLHRVKDDEVFHFYAGDPVEMIQLKNSGEFKLLSLGSRLARGEQPQVLVKAGTWQGSRLEKGGKWALLGTTVAPPFEFSGFELGNRDKLIAQFPEHAEMIEAFT